MRLGGTETIKVDVRIVAAANVDLLGLVREGRFREDLYHRLNVIALHLPPLRARREDVPLLLDHFLRRFSEENGRPLRRFTSAAMKVLVDYDWPGNIRELENVVERAVVLSAEDLMDSDLLPEVVLEKTVAGGAHRALGDFLAPGQGSSLQSSSLSLDLPQGVSSLFEIMEEIERRVIVDMLERTSWNQTEAAERFQIPLSTLNQKIKRLGIETRRRGAGRSAESTAHVAGK
jgi:DNA-binding NtrC family response regulator